MGLIANGWAAGAVIVSTPQDVALSDVRKGVTMFRKISVPVRPSSFSDLLFRSPRLAQILGLLLNQSYFTCPSCSTPHHLYGPPDLFRATAARLGAPVLGELPITPSVSRGGDAGIPHVLMASDKTMKESKCETGWNDVMKGVAAQVWAALPKRNLVHGGE